MADGDAGLCEARLVLDGLKTRAFSKFGENEVEIAVPLSR